MDKNDFSVVPPSTGSGWTLYTNRKDFSINQIYSRTWVYKTEAEALAAIDILDKLNCYNTFAHGRVGNQIKEIYSRFYHGKRKATPEKTFKMCDL